MLLPEEVAQDRPAGGGNGLGEVARRYAASLVARRLASATVTGYVRATAHFVAWWTRHQRGDVSSVGRRDVEAFAPNHLRRCRCRSRVVQTRTDCRAALHHLLRLLGSDTPARPTTPIEEEVTRYDVYLRQVCGMAEATRIHGTRHVREFLAGLFRGGPVSHREIRPQTLSRFVMARARHCRPGSAGVITDGLRSYVRYLEECDQCGYARFAYHSCRDRHCPRCGTLDQAIWAEAQERSLLPVPYFHAVFTVPAALHPLFRRSPSVALGLLFEAVSETLLRMAHSRLGARIASTAVLHTWNQRLLYHPHVHCLVTGGGLSDDGTRWVACRPGFFLPYAVLRRVFRGKLLSKLAAALDDKVLGVGRSLGRHLLAEAARQRWVVYAQAPLAGPSQVVRYVSRYTRRIALSDSRIVDYDGEEVALRWRDRAHGNQKILSLRGPESARRFVSHILPAHFVRIRHFGLLSNRIREAMLERCRTLLLGNEVAPLPPWPRNDEDRASTCLRLFGKDPARCPACGRGRMRLRYEWAPSGRVDPLFLTNARAP